MTTSVIASMLEILAVCINEADELPHTVLEAVFLPLTLPQKRENPPAYALSQRLIHRCNERLQPVLTEMFKDISEGRFADSDLAQKTHELIFELNKISASTLVHILPQLEPELKVEDKKTRHAMVNLLAHLFATSYNLTTSYRPLFQAFLQRFNDKKASIRMLMLEFARHYIVVHADPDLSEDLFKRLRDPKERVRKVAVASVCSALMDNYNCVSPKLLAELGDRMRDKKPEVRHMAIKHLARLYVLLRAKWGARKKWAEENLKKFGWIPAKIMCCYLLLQPLEDKLYVCKTIETVLLPDITGPEKEAGKSPKSPKSPNKKQRMKKRSRWLVDLVESFDKHAHQALHKLLGDKRQFQQEFGTLLGLKKELNGKGKKDGDTLKFERKLKEVAELFPYPTVDKSCDALARLLGVRFVKKEDKEEKAKDKSGKESEQIIAQLRVMADPNMPMSKQAQACKHALSVIGTGKRDFTRRKFVEALVERLSMTLITCDNIPYVFERLASFQTQDKDEPDHSTALLSLLNNIAALYPSFMSESLESITELMKEKDKRFLNTGVQMLVHCGHLFKDTPPDTAHFKRLQKRLVELTSGAGGPFQAKRAVLALSQLLDDPRPAFQKLLSELFSYLKKQTPSKFDSDVTAILHACGYVAVACPAAFEKTGPKIASWVQDTLISMEAVASPVKGKKHQPKRAIVRAKKYGIKLLVRYLLSLGCVAKKGNDDKGNDDDVARSVMMWLLDLAQKGGVVQGTQQSAAERHQLKRSCVLALVKLSYHRHYEALLSPQHFQTLAFCCVTFGDSDDAADARRRIVHKLASALYALHLPLRFLAMLVLFSRDDVKQIAAEVKAGIVACIAQRRSVHSQHITVDNPEEQAMQNFAVLPEYALPYLVSLLAHSPYIEEDAKSQFTNTCLLLTNLLAPLMQQGNTVELLQQLARFMKLTDDAFVPPMTLMLRRVAELAERIIAEKTSNKTYKGAPSSLKVLLPPDYFKPPASTVPLDQDGLLPKDFQLPDAVAKSKHLQNIFNPHTATTPRKEKEKEKEATTQKKKTLKQQKLDDFAPPEKKKARKGKENQKEEDEEQEDGEEKKDEENDTIKEKDKEVRKRKEKGKGEEEEEEEEEEEPPKPEQKPQQAKAPAPSPKTEDEGEAAEMSPSSRRKRFWHRIVHRRKKDMKKHMDIVLHDHQVDLPVLLHNLEVDAAMGLTHDQRTVRQAQFGMNRLSPPKRTPEIVKLLKNLFGFFSALLWVGAVISIASYAVNFKDMSNLYLAIVLVFVVTVTGVFSYLQERHSSNVMSKFMQVLPQKCQVKSEGSFHEMASEELVRGDIVSIGTGDKAPADLRVLECTSDLKVDNSSLTGESEPQPRSTECTAESPLETENLIFMGSSVVSGSGTGTVILTGDETIIGKVAGLASATSQQSTEMHRETMKFVWFLLAIAFSQAIVLMIISTVITKDFLSSLILAVGLIVANVPEGMLPTITASLVLTAKRLAKLHVLVKRIEVVETLGSCTCICSDKTGTLTQNKMTASHLWVNGKQYSCDDAEFNPEKTDGAIKLFLTSILLCSNATFVWDEIDQTQPLSQWKIKGDASESALLRFCHRMFNADDVRKKNPRLFHIPFNSTNKFMVSVNKITEGALTGSVVVTLKGAPERVIMRCGTALVNGHEVANRRRQFGALFERQYEHFGSLGERVLGVACRVLDPSEFGDDFRFTEDDGQFNFPMDDMCFLGLVTLIDPPRKDVSPAVVNCKTAGIKVIMVTGDHPTTAKAVAKQVGIITEETREDIILRKQLERAKVRQAKIDAGEPVSPEEEHNGEDDYEAEDAKAIVIVGSDIPNLTDADWDHVLSHQQIVFARTSPQQKLVVVEHNQKRGEIVLVTGDGVNDSAALKKADIGAAMGITGSDVSKEAADIILLDDNFSSIVVGVEQGRLIFDNLRKSMCYTLTHELVEVFPFLLYVILQFPLPLTTILILFVDLGTDMIPAISLAYELAEKDIMAHPAREEGHHLVDPRMLARSYLINGVIHAAGGFFTYMMAMHINGFHITDLFWNANNWNDKYKYVAGYDFDYRVHALRVAQTSWLVAIVVLQWVNMIICKTRRTSFFDQAFKNWHLIGGYALSVVIIISLVYVPYFNTAMGAAPIPALLWVCPLPFAAAELVMEESRKLFVVPRKNTNAFWRRLHWLTRW
eukprot:TRINITY_DN1604_c0_g2_i3.p1 TRINITY_DN1604_c0_g2~~TRINITY_DN1604_c0_g2_i3.p1  ORF type:complete len:2171 (-),score=664.74 TRINITY_DN1604_c0_g2_i3:1683-8195(-)